MNLPRPIKISLFCNILEWYDFALYGCFSFIIGKLFFATGNDIVNMIATFTLYAAGYFARPVGGMIFGYIGDKYGRSRALSIAIMFMAVPSTIIGLLPTYKDVGILAPVLLSVCRMIQGISMGGMNGAFIYILEHGKDRPLYYSSLTYVTTCLGIMLASVMAAIISSLLGEQEFINYGWRIAFILSLFFGSFVYYMRRQIIEAEIFIKAKLASQLQNPLKEVATKHKIKLLQAMGIYLSMSVSSMVLMIFNNNFVNTILHLPQSQAFKINLLTLVAIILAVIISGKIASKANYKKLMSGALLINLCAVYPLQQMINHPDFWQILLVQFTQGMILGLFCGPLYYKLVSLFPIMIRYSGLGIAMNLSASLFASVVPLIGAWLLKHYSPATTLKYISFYIILCNVISLICLSARNNHEN